MIWYAWIFIHLHLSQQSEEVVAVATFFHTKTGSGLLLAVGLLAVVALGPMAVSALIALVFMACVVELALFAYFIKSNQVKNAYGALVLQSLIVTGGALAMTYVVHSYGSWLTMIVVAAVYCENAGAQIFGKVFGRTKLAPRYSPNKTLEGAVAGWVCGNIAGIALLVLASLWPNEVEVTWEWAWIALAAPPLAEFGDWIESRLKRRVGVKDSGDLTKMSTPVIRILGLSWLLHRQGGALDKTDSLWFVMCIVPWMLISPLFAGIVLGLIVILAIAYVVKLD